HDRADILVVLSHGSSFAFSSEGGASRVPLVRSEGDAQARAEGYVARSRRIDVDPVVCAFDGDGVGAVEWEERADATLESVVALFASVCFLTVESGPGEESGVSIRFGEAVLDDAVGV